jgi:hypothetical protein
VLSEEKGSEKEVELGTGKESLMRSSLMYDRTKKLSGVVYFSSWTFPRFDRPEQYSEVCIQFKQQCDHGIPEVIQQDAEH